MSVAAGFSTALLRQQLPLASRLVSTAVLRRGLATNLETRKPSERVSLPEPVSASKAKPLREYDVFIVGGGVTGTALLYTLSNFTNIPRIGLAERRADFAQVSSGPNNNSQTIHCGDIETNYTSQKARLVKAQADKLRNYATKLPPALKNSSVYKMQKMVLGVGDDECMAIEQRYHMLKPYFPKMQLISKSQIKELEPNIVKVSNHRDRKETLSALYIPNDHSAVNYYYLSHSFISQAKQIASQTTNKVVDVSTGTSVLNIIKDHDKQGYLLHTNKGTFRTRYLVVAACGYSLLFAQRLGYASNLSCFPVAGSFYFSRRPVLNGKVYTIQKPKLPFAAVHGDPDVHAQGMTRFGPTALPLPLLERYNLSSLKDFVEVAGVDLRLLGTYLKTFSDPSYLAYSLRNIVYELPFFGVRSFLRDVKKIVPGIKVKDLYYAHGFGGVRPQVVDKTKMAISLGEAKIKGENVIFNITPSPGGTTCLGTAEQDTKDICAALDYSLDFGKMKANLYDGEYPVER